MLSNRRAHRACEIDVSEEMDKSECYIGLTHGLHGACNVTFKVITADLLSQYNRWGHVGMGRTDVSRVCQLYFSKSNSFCLLLMCTI